MREVGVSWGNVRFYADSLENAKRNAEKYAKKHKAHITDYHVVRRATPYKRGWYNFSFAHDVLWTSRED